MIKRKRDIMEKTKVSSMIEDFRVWVKEKINN